MNEMSILSVGDRVNVINKGIKGKVVRIHFDKGDIVVMDDHHGAEHLCKPQYLERIGRNVTGEVPTDA